MAVVAPTFAQGLAMILEVRGISKKFGGTVALSDITFDVPKGSIFGVIGPNGAGKTTLFNVLTGFIKVDAGSMKLEGVDLMGLPSEAICEAGMCRTFQITRPFMNLNVLDNVIVAALARCNSIDEAIAEADAILKRVGIYELRFSLGRSLNVVQRKRLELARALATRPKVLLLDEVLGGLNPTEVNQSIVLLRELNAQGITLIIIEHIMAAINSLCGQVLVLHHGEQLTQAPPDEIAGNPQVVGAYLGEEFLIARG
jgi:branched-chain amino acid transport system ATP-binding protein